MPITRRNIRRELFNQVPGLGFYGTADSLTGTTLTDTYAFQDTNLSADQFRGAYLYRPDRTGDDIVRKIGALTNTTGVITHTGAAWVNTADTLYEVVGAMHPDELNAGIQRALQRIYFEVQTPLCGELENFDGDMDANNVTNWADVGTPTTKAKVTTSAHVFSGFRALRVLNDTAGEGAQSATIRGFPTNGGEWVYVSAVVRADVGTARLSLYNVTASSVIASVDSAEEGLVHLWLRYQLPAGAEEVAVRLVGVESTADLYWNHVAFYRRSTYVLPAPSWLNEPYKFLKLREARYMKVIQSLTNGAYDDAYSRTFADWVQPSMFSLDPMPLDVNPYQVQLARPLPENELWISARRPYSDIEALSADTDTTTAPERQIYAYCKNELGSILKKRYPKDARWDVVLAEAQLEIESETRPRTETPMRAIKQEHWGRV